MKIPNITIQQLLEAGVHLGHKTLRWNPKMKKYIFGKRDSIHIIDLTQTLELTNEALKKVYNTIINNEKILFVSTKKQASEAIAEVESAVEEQESGSDEQKQETKADKAKAVQAIVTRVLQAVQMAGGDADSTKLALMGMLGSTGFRSYQQQQIPDVAFYDSTVEYISPTYDDLLGGIFNLGSDQMMDEMIDSQYK